MSNAALICCDCGMPADDATPKAKASKRCDKCQRERDDYYYEKLRQEHAPERPMQDDYYDLSHGDTHE